MEPERNEVNEEIESAENVTPEVGKADTGAFADAEPDAVAVDSAAAEMTAAEEIGAVPETEEEAVPAVTETGADTGAAETAACTSDVPQESGAVPDKEENHEKIVYRWTYTGQREANEKNAAKKNSGVGIYIAMVSAAFAVCLLILAAVLLIGGKVTTANYVGGDGTRVVFVHDGEGDDDSLTAQEIALSVSPSVVGIRSSLSGGSVGEGAGIILTEDGLILTNYHVVEDATSVLVYLYGESGQMQEDFYRAKLVGAKPEYDLAVLSIEADGLSAAAFGDSDSIMVGDTVYAVGHPGGLEFGWTFSDGVISGTNRTVTNEYKYNVTVIQSNVTVNTGNSGGPMLNDAGEVIGVITMKLTGDYQGMNFAIPGNTALTVAQDIIANGGDTDESAVINRPYVGITGTTARANTWMYYDEETGSVFSVTDATHTAVINAERLMNGNYWIVSATDGSGETMMMSDEDREAILSATYIPANGVFVVSVMEDSGAYGNLQAGDVIIVVDDVEIGTMDNMIELLSGYKAGDVIRIRYIRDGEERVCPITLTEQNR